MKKCPYCQEKIQDSAKKCRYCGEWLEGTTSSTQVSTTQRKNFKKIFTLLGISLFVILCGIILFILWGPHTRENPAEVSTTSGKNTTQTQPNKKPSSKAPTATKTLEEKCREQYGINVHATTQGGCECDFGYTLSNVYEKKMCTVCMDGEPNVNQMDNCQCKPPLKWSADRTYCE